MISFPPGWWRAKSLLSRVHRSSRGLAVAPKVAVLIDGDNVSPKIVPQLFNHVARIGEPTVRRVYLNVAGTGARWPGTVAGHSLSPIHLTSVAPGKNAADIALTVDAMDLLHRSRPDAFVIVSSDADFTRLAIRIREQGFGIHGYGASNTPASFQRACTSFTFIEDLVLKGAGGAVGSAKWTLAPTDAEALLVLAVLRLGSGIDEVELSRLGSYLSQHEPQFDPKVFRCRTLGDLVGKLQSLEVSSRAGNLMVRIRIGEIRNQSTSIPR